LIWFLLDNTQQHKHLEGKKIMTGLTLMCGYATLFFAAAVYMEKKFENK